jgi:hypothetical protein
MMQPILQQVAALAERAEVRQPIIGRIAVKVRRRQHDARHAEPHCLDEVRPSGRPSTAIPPCRRLFIEPTSVWQTSYKSQVWPATTLAPSSSTSEANVVAELAPVWRIQRS